MRTFFVILLILTFAGYTQGLTAQQEQSMPPANSKIAACMLAKGDTAVTVCYRTLETGVRDAAVYHKIATEHYKAGELERARVMLGTALSIHREDENLLSLESMLENKSVAAEEILLAAKKNEARWKQAPLKAACLTRFNDAAITACRLYLQLTGDEDQSVQFRLTDLEGTEYAVTHESDSVDTSSNEFATVNEQEASSKGTTHENSKTGIGATNQSAIVMDAQLLLNELGFDVGVPDGQSGKRTRNALGRFYRQAGLPEQERIDASTIEHLRVEKAALLVAEQFFSQSRLANERGNVVQAMEYIQQASDSSTLLRIPPDYHDKLDALLVNLEVLIREIRSLESVLENQNTTYVNRTRSIRSMSRYVRPK